MKKRIAFLVFSLFLIKLAHAQSDKLNELTVDRPGIAESPFTVAPGMFQFETGFDYYSRSTGKLYYLPVQNCALPHDTLQTEVIIILSVELLP